jgi:predicted PurR-regulated permease PerM
LAVLAGLLESIPSLGPTLSALPAILLAFFTSGPVGALIVTIGYMIIQQLENTLIVPRVMANAVGLKPIVVIIAVATGFTLAGPLGALLSVPIAVLFQIAYEFYIDLQKLRAKGIV